MSHFRARLLVSRRTRALGLIIAVILHISTVSGELLPSRTIFVDPSSGDDGNDGADASRPLRSVQKCVDMLVDISNEERPVGAYESNIRARCAIRGGEYHLNESVVIERLYGDDTGRFEVSAYADEVVDFVGYRYLDPQSTTWIWKEGASSGAEPRIGHWYTTLDESIPDPWQLFVDGEMMVNARWPDARWDDKSMFYAKNWAHGSSSSVFVDDTQADSTMVEGDGGKLGESNLNFTGASAILNIKHWFTFATSVEWHNPGENSFTYRKQPGWKGSKYVPSHDLFYLENKPELISQETEWHYDKNDRVLRLALKGGANARISSLKIGLRVQEYAFRCTHSTYVTLKNMGFHGTTVWAGAIKFNENVRGIVYDSLRFKYPSAQKRMLGDHRHSWPTTLFERAVESGPCYNKIFNCTFTGSEGDPSLYTSGAGIVFDNNRFVWNDFTAITTVPCWPGVLTGKSTKVYAISQPMIVTLVVSTAVVAPHFRVARGLLTSLLSSAGSRTQIMRLRLA